MTNESPFVSMDEVASTPGPTEGLRPAQIRFDVKSGYLPGRINHRKKVEIRRAEWDAYLSGEWQPAEPGSHKQEAPAKPASKPGIVSIERKAS